MNSETIYKEATDIFLKKIRHLRDQWEEEGIRVNGLSSILDVTGSDYEQYEYIMQECVKTSYSYIYTIIDYLLKLNQIPVQYYAFSKEKNIIYFAGTEKKLADSINDPGTEQQIYSFRRTDTKDNVVYVFKEFGVANRLPIKIETELIDKYPDIDCFHYISIVDDNAYSEIINHNDDVNDPGRGTNTFSLQYFFDLFFGHDEYVLFKKHMDMVSHEIKEYLGFYLIRSLKPNTVNNFRTKIYKELLKIETIVANTDFYKRLDPSQKELVNYFFYNQNKYQLLLGNSDFALSFMTAEWLYFSLKNVGNIDLTSIVMGYFKSIEQFLLRYLTFHTVEKEGRSIQIRCSTKEYKDLTDDFIKDKLNHKFLPLGNLTGFFGFYNEKENKYVRRNSFLLEPKIKENTHELIIDVFSHVSKLRNGYSHKDNLTNWTKVDEIRNSTYLFYYAFLGSYKLSASNLLDMGIIQIKPHDEIYLLNKHMKKRAKEMGFSVTILPTYYIIENGKTSDILFYEPDYDVKYDNLGETIYSGIYLKEMLTQKIRKYTSENMPKEIWEGMLIIDGKEGFKFTPTGPIKKIYSDGKYMAP